jgi:hypothetical protein
MTVGGTGKRMGAVVSSRMRPRVALVAWTVPFLLFFLSAFLSSRIVAARHADPSRGAASAVRGGLLFEASRRPFLSFGFRNFLADMAWLGAVQAAAPVRMSGDDYDRLAVLIRTVNNFDPRFDVPYLLGGMILGESPARAGDALAILERGAATHPSEWRMPFYMGYIHYFTLEDPVSGGEALRRAARIPGSPPYLALLASRMLAEGRRIDTASDFLAEMVRHEGDPARREALTGRLLDLRTEGDLQRIEEAVKTYRDANGFPPARLQDLVAAGFLAGVPREPRGGRYSLSGDGEVRSDRMKQRLRGFRHR